METPETTVEDAPATPPPRNSRRPASFDEAPGLARIAAGAWLRTAGWTAGLALRAGRRTLDAAVSGENPLELLREAQAETLATARRVLEIADLGHHLGDADSGRRATLRDRGQALLERSSGLGPEADEHPAYARILDQLSPDEARILRLLAEDGPQPAVDVRTWRPLDIGSNVVAPGLTMIAQRAGARHPARVPAYLSNLYRLGLIWFSRESLPDPEPYQVLEVQPDVVEAIRETGRARVVRRSIHLTPFGADFCRVCLPVDAPDGIQAPGLQGETGDSSVA
jgi:hypothetical protein